MPDVLDVLAELTLRCLSYDVFGLWCLAAARERLGPAASERKVRETAEAIRRFVWGDMVHPSRALH